MKPQLQKSEKQDVATTSQVTPKARLRRVPRALSDVVLEDPHPSMSDEWLQKALADIPTSRKRSRLVLGAATGASGSMLSVVAAMSSPAVLMGAGPFFPLVFSLAGWLIGYYLLPKLPPLKKVDDDYEGSIMKSIAFRKQMAAAREKAVQVDAANRLRLDALLTELPERVSEMERASALPNPAVRGREAAALAKEISEKLAEIQALIKRPEKTQDQNPAKTL